MVSFDRQGFIDHAGRELNRNPGASLNTIAAGAGVDPALASRSFADRDELLREVAVAAIDRWQASQRAAEMVGAVETGEGDRLTRCVRELLRAYVADTAEYGLALDDRFLGRFPDLQERVEEMRAGELRLLRAAQEAGVLRGDVSTEWIMLMVYGHMMAAREALGTTPRAVVEQHVLKTFFDGFGSA